MSSFSHTIHQSHITGAGGVVVLSQTDIQDDPSSILGPATSIPLTRPRLDNEWVLHKEGKFYVI